MQLSADWLNRQGDDSALLQAVDCVFTHRPARIGVAVSGGGDSVALLHLYARWSVQTGHPIAAVTVDHGLRADSRQEAEGVAALCRSLDIPHTILDWHRTSGAGNLPAAARQGRYGLMAQWARARGIGSIVLGHTLEDSAENFLMRLGRASGLDGLSEMAGKFERGGVRWARPLLQCKRDDLRAYLERHSVAWVEDPSNEDPRYQRTKARQVLPHLATLGITAQALQQTAGALRQSRDALMHYLRQDVERYVTQEAGDLLIPQDIGAHVPDEIARRISLAALHWVGSDEYGPRKSFSGILRDDLATQERLSIAGCLIMKRKGAYRITREYNAVKDLVTATDVVWDRRWRLDGPHDAGLEIRALGESVSAVPDWRKTGLPRRSLTASPAVWRGESLVAAPLAGYNREWTAQIVADFISFLESH